MSHTTPRRPLRRRLALAGALAVGAALVAVAPTASASDDDVRANVRRPIRPGAPVTVVVTHKAGYVTSTCVMDILEGRCQSGVRRGESRTFTVKPPKGSPIAIRVVPDRGVSTEVSFDVTGAQMCFTTAGRRTQPTVTAVACA